MATESFDKEFVLTEKGLDVIERQIQLSNFNYLKSRIDKYYIECSKYSLAKYNLSEVINELGLIENLIDEYYLNDKINKRQYYDLLCGINSERLNGEQDWDIKGDDND